MGTEQRDAPPPLPLEERRWIGWLAGGWCIEGWCGRGRKHLEGVAIGISVGRVDGRAAGGVTRKRIS